MNKYQKMMSAAVGAVLLTTLAPVLFAQRYSRIDFDSVRQRITDSASPYYYPVLLKRYKANDITLRRDDYSYLYYGYVFHDQYDPVNVVQAKQEKTMLGRFKAGRYKQALALAQPLSAGDPLNLKYLYWAGRCSEKTRDTLAALAYRNHWRNLAEAIAASGDGRTKETAYVVIRVHDEYQILQALGLAYTDHIFRGDPARKLYYDVFALKPNAQGRDTVYFNTNWSYQYLNETIEQQQNGRP